MDSITLNTLLGTMFGSLTSAGLCVWRMGSKRLGDDMTTLTVISSVSLVCGLGAAAIVMR